MTTATAPVLEAKGLVKVFGRVIGLNDVDLTLYPGEVLAVIGDNGAGKSSLIKAISGAALPDEGEIRLEGKTVAFKSPRKPGLRISRPRNMLSAIDSAGDRARFW